jgi:hypothetical protein
MRVAPMPLWLGFLSRREFCIRQLPMRPSTSGASSGMSTVAGMDADIERLLGGSDPSDALPAPHTALSGEQLMARKMIRSALADAARPGEGMKVTRQREDARAWLMDAAALLSARVCFEALGIDYDGAKVALEKAWAAGTAIVPKKRYVMNR